MGDEPDLFTQAIARLPRWILLLAVVGTAGAGFYGGAPVGGGFLLGAVAAFFNFRLIERSVNRLSRLASAEPERAAKARGTGVFIQFAGLLTGSVVILNYSGFSMAAAFFGFLVCPAAVVLEILYELIKYGYS